MHKIFISYHHQLDQKYKNHMINNWNNIYFIDGSVDTNDIDPDLSPQRIREIIRDDYLRDTSVTVVLVGKCTQYRKHIDWEIGSSMIDGLINKKSGIVIIEIPNENNKNNTSGIGASKMKEEFAKIGVINWVNSSEKNQNRHPNLPSKLKENVDRENVNIPIIQWDDIYKNPSILEEAINYAYDERRRNDYYVSEFRKHNNNNCF